MKKLDLENKKALKLKDGQRIWKQFQRFAEYEDLKDLYKKVMPELSKFEDKIEGFNFSLEQLNNIIRRFDENMSQKVDK